MTKKQMQSLFLASMCFICVWMGGIISYYIGQEETQPQKQTEEKKKDKNDNLIDHKPTEWRRLNSNGYSQKYVYLTWENRTERMHQLLDAYWHDNYYVRKTVARIHKIYPEMLICIAYADSSLWRFLKTENNFGNVGNNDRGETVGYDTPEQGINAIWRVLNNHYLWDYSQVNQLSRYGNKDGSIYASSPENRHINVMNCLGMIRDQRIPDDWNYRW